MPALLTGVAAVITAVTGTYVALKRADAPPAIAPDAKPRDALPQDRSADTRRETVAPPALSGRWRDNWGNVSTVVQNGSSYRFEIDGVSCTGRPFRSSGTGTVSGHVVQSTYHSSLPSQGSCSGNLSADGLQLTTTCTDSACGTFVSVSVRQP